MKTSFKVIRRHETVYTGGALGSFPGCSLIAAVRDEDVQILDVSSQLQSSAVLPGDGTDVTAVAIRPDGRKVVTAHVSHQVREWADPRSQPKSPSKTWKLTGAFVASMAFDSTGTLLALGCTDARVRVWESERGYFTHSFRVPQGGVVGCVAFSPAPESRSSPLLATAAEDLAIRVWDLTAKTCDEMRGHLDAVGALAFTPDGATLVSSGRDNVLNVWSMESRTLVATVPAFESIVGLSFLEDDGVVYGAGEKGAMKAWSISDGKLLWSRDKGPGSGVTFTRVVQASTGTSPVLIGATEDHNLVVFPGRGIAETPPRVVVGNRDQVADIQFVSGSRVVVVDNSERPQVLDLGTGEAEVLEGHSDLVLCCAVGRLADGRTTVVTGSRDRTVRAWDPEAGACLGTCEGHTDAVGAVAVLTTDAGPRIVSASNDTTIKVWKFGGSGEEMEDEGPWTQKASLMSARAHDKDVNSIAVSPNGKLIATGSQDRTVKIWRTADLSTQATLAGHRRGVWAVCFSPVDQVVASASADTTVKIWSLSSATCLKTFEGHTGAVLRVAFASRGMQLLTTGADSLVKLWTVKTNECVNTFDVHTDKVWALGVKPGSDGSSFVTAGSDAVVCVWEDCTAEVEEGKKAEMDSRALQEQKLESQLRTGKFSQALETAFALNHPRHVLQILKSIIDSAGPTVGDEGEEEGEKVPTLHELVGKMTKEHLRLLVGFAVDWNTTVKHCDTAQLVLNAIFRSVGPTKLKEAVPNLKQILEALIPYTERHLKHADHLLQRSRILDYTRSTLTTVAQQKLETEADDEREKRGKDVSMEEEGGDDDD